MHCGRGGQGLQDEVAVLGGEGDEYLPGRAEDGEHGSGVWGGPSRPRRALG